jgi:hypothetical protein
MRIFEAWNTQHILLYLLPALVFVVLFAAGLGFAHIRRRDAEERLTRIVEEYPGGITGRNAPFPLLLMLIIAGTLLWGLLYIVITGTWGVRI